VTVATFIRSAAVLEVSDVVSSVAWYTEKLGFGSRGFWGDPPCFCIVGRGMVTIFLDNSRKKPRAVPVNQYWAAYVYVDDIEATSADFKSRGATIARENESTEYGCRDFDVCDPDGHIIGFGQVIEPGPEGPRL
jgi:predicted enzyme related to lactoylglutathione lyase